MNPLADRPILIASGNIHKHKEICRALDLPSGKVLTPLDIEETAGTAPDPVEDGDSLLENAIIKAKAFSKWSGMPALADDTGLFVDDLGGNPGVHSARYAGENASFSDNVEKLLRELSAVPESSNESHFSCVLVLCDKDEIILSVEGTCPGHITESPRGSDGFGYDPVFIPLNETQTFSEMTPDEKDQLSHRGQAVRKFANLYKEILTTGAKS
ncbi:RdgB/HAM1 family non-canonical purine NTP pyrophosphatase [Planctomycetota bacterium]|nr:RdgB/HAM1 family non-canonical purine NTP pyrophosphatase [Planctomycetota bacterium]